MYAVHCRKHIRCGVKSCAGQGHHHADLARGARADRISGLRRGGWVGGQCQQRPAVGIAGVEQLPQDTPAVCVGDVQADSAMQLVVSSRPKAANPNTVAKCRTVTTIASSSSPAPAAMPTAADSHIAAAVVNPCTARGA